MTVTEDFISVEESELEAAAPAYPTAFGVTFTPAISGILIAVLGLAGALYLILNQLMPAWQKNQELQASRDQKQSQVEQNEASLRQGQKVKTDLAQAKQQKAEILTLFANEKSLDTLLLDLNRLIESANAKLQRNDVRAKLKKFVPAKSAEVITDGSLGPEVNGKLQRQVVNVEIEGPTAQTQAILRNIERLQSLLIVKDYQSTLVQAPTDQQTQVVRSSPATITTSFQLQALIPLSAEEAAKAAPPPVNQPPK